MAWHTTHAAQLYGIGMSWNYMVATVMRDAAVVPYVFGTELPGIAMVMVSGEVSPATDMLSDVYYSTSYRKKPDTQGSGAYGRFLLSDWQELPNGQGFKWDRAKGTFSTGACPSNYAGARFLLGIAKGPQNNYANTRAFAMSALSATTGAGNASFSNGLDNGSTATLGNSVGYTDGTSFASTPMAIDLSFAMPTTAFSNGCKANFEMRNLLCAAAIQHSLVGYKHRWVEKTATGRPLVVNIRSGSLSGLDPNAANSDPILATFNLYSEDFTTPDVNGVTNTTATQVVSASNTGTAGYAEMIGSYSSTGATPKLFVPVGTVAADNQITLLSLSTVSGQNVTLVDCGFKFSLAT